MQIADYKSPTFVDYPGEVALTVYLQGCNKNCFYCFNKHLIPRTDGAVSPQELMKVIDQRKDFITAVVFTGGEPTIHPNLASFMRRVRMMGLLVGMHTNGTGEYLIDCLAEADYILFSGDSEIDHDNVKKIVVNHKL